VHLPRDVCLTIETEVVQCHRTHRWMMKSRCNFAEFQRISNVRFAVYYSKTERAHIEPQVITPEEEEGKNALALYY